MTAFCTNLLLHVEGEDSPEHWEAPDTVSSGPSCVPAEVLGHSGFGEAQSLYSPLGAVALAPGSPRRVVLSSLGAASGQSPGKVPKYVCACMGTRRGVHLRVQQSIKELKPILLKLVCPPHFVSLFPVHRRRVNTGQGMGQNRPGGGRRL